MAPKAAPIGISPFKIPIFSCLDESIPKYYDKVGLLMTATQVRLNPK